MNIDAALRRLDLSARPALVAAISGGSDSLALLVLLKSFQQTHAPRLRLLAVTVDHGLRPESADEARAVAALCGSLGIEHRIMTWRGDKPRSGVSAASREARYRLLAEAADGIGADCVLTGHTMDDQAETVAMRSKRGDGSGLAGMANATLYDERIWIVRPMLAMRRQALRDHLTALKLGWIDDPSNLNDAYERVRVRRSLTAAGSVEALAERAAVEGTRRGELAAGAGDLIDRFARWLSPGLYRLDPKLPLQDERETVRLALRALLATVGGAVHLPDPRRAEALRARLAGGGPLRATLSRAVIDARRDGIWLWREARNLPEAIVDEATLWDGRWRIAADRGPLPIGPLGEEAAARVDEQAVDAPAHLARLARASEPVLLSPDGERHAANGREARCAGVAAMPVVAPHARFLPGFDLVLAAALRRLVGAPPLPPAPWKKHIDA